MRASHFNFSPIALTIALSTILGASSILIQGPLPGDILLTQGLQSLFGSGPAWAHIMTSTAKQPLVWLALVLGGLLAYTRAGWRGTGTVAITFFAAKIIDMALRALIHVPRPLPELVQVASVSTSSGLPSTNALVYGAIFIPVLIANTRSGWVQSAAATAAILLLIAGTMARVVLGGHWMSQIMASLLLAGSIGLLVYQILQSIPSRRLSKNSDRSEGEAG
ncbi:MAG: phosphatase PAP2 family protein [Nitrosomonas halophila]